MNIILFFCLLLLFKLFFFNNINFFFSKILKFLLILNYYKNNEKINIETLSQQELFLKQCDQDKDRKRNKARKEIWMKESNKISCPRALYAVQYFNTITKEPGNVHIYFRNQHLDECKTHSF